MHKVYMIAFFLLGFQLSGTAQEQPVRFAAGDFVTGSNITKGSFSSAQLQPALYNGTYYVLIQFATLPDAGRQAEMANAGIRLYHYLPGNAYLASVSSSFNFGSAARYGIASINALPALYKSTLRPGQLEQGRSKQQQQMLAVQVFGIADRFAVLNELQRAGAVVRHNRFSSGELFFIEPDIAAAAAVAQLPFVSSIGMQQVQDKVLNYKSTGMHAVSGLQNGRGLSGSGVTVGIGDDADPTTHSDFNQRIINRTPGFSNNHGTHVTGTTAGGGLLNPLYKGMAPRATVVSQIFSNIIVNAPAYITDHGMVLTNNSYYTGDDSCTGNNRYDVYSSYADAQARTYSQLLHVVAAGNDGSFTCAGYPAAFATIKSGWQCGKNVLTVGAIKPDDYSVTFFSSRGPVQDGRLKPELVANGWGVSSTYINDNYAWYFGTSMAAPNVTGALALVEERYRQLHSGANAPAALLKAVACNTAEDLGKPGPDFSYGFGMINARRAAAAVEENRWFTGTVAAGAQVAHNITVPAGAVRVKVLLYWADKEGIPNAAAALVNDLDLTVTTPSLAVHNPLVLNSTPAGVNLPAAEGADHRNNIEQVVIENPAAGTYTISINGFAVPFGPQQYYITYEVVNPSVTVEYPWGGETWVPAAAETIRWNAYGSNTETFTVEYSADNGSSWTVLSSTVPDSIRTYVWDAGPAAATNTAKVRVRRNNTALQGQSGSFVVLGQPVLSAANACEGAVQLSWTAVTAATGYEVMQLIGDTMKVIGNTTALNYLVTGLRVDTMSQFAVRAINGTTAGRRSVAAGIVACCGACTLPAFDNDVAAVAVLEPITAREFTAAAPNADKAVKVRFKNLDNAPISGPMTVSCTINGVARPDENISPTVAAGAFFEHTFAQHPVTLDGALYLDIKVWITRAGDANRANDTVYALVKRLGNPQVLSLPVAENFETTTAADYRKTIMGLAGNDRFDFAGSTVYGRGRTFINTGFARSGSKAFTLDQYPAAPTPAADSLTATYNMTFHSLSAAQLRYDFYYKSQGQPNTAGNKVWMRGSENDSWVEAYNLSASQAAPGQWKFASINVNDVLQGAVPPQNLSASFQVRFGQQGQQGAASAVPDTEYDFEDGLTFDDVRLTDALNDVSLAAVVSPDKKGCGLGSATPVTVTVRNHHNTALNNIAVSYRINGGATVTENIPVLNAGQSLQYTFTATASFSAYTEYNCDFWVNYGPDTYRGNDSLLAYTFRNSPVISSFPYLEGFESSNGNWYAAGRNSSWQWGQPANTIINKAANGANAWVTGLTGNYRNNELSYLYSPCFDLTGMAQPVLSFSHIFSIEDNCPCDYTWVEYSADGGITWQKLGAPGSGTSWYDAATAAAWQVSQPGWHVASIPVPVAQANVRFRFVMSSDGGVTREGVGIDDIHIFDRQPVYTGPSLAGLSQAVSGSSWVHFTDAGGRRVLSVNALGQNLGTVQVQVHPWNGAVRSSNSQYYASRNIVVQAAQQPASAVKLRFYFTDAEARALINATGCAGCGKPADPYELGITRYSSTAAEENGTLSDNATGSYSFISPAAVDIIPYDSGYYAEYEVSSFSEHWLSKASIAPPLSSSCPGDTITFTAAAAGSTYQWQEDSGSGFVNITNGINYAGATTGILKLMNLPTSSTGFRYRCVVNGVPGNPVTLRFVRLWNGTAGTDWFNTANWGCGLLPDQYTDVVLPAGLTNYPQLSGNAAIRSLKANGGSTVVVATGSNLEIKGQ